MDQPLKVTVLAGGIGGARFLKGLRMIKNTQISVIANNADDITLHGLRICPDLDSIIYNLAGVADLTRGWGRAEESWKIQEELTKYSDEQPWFNLGDKDFATHIYRSELLRQGVPLHEIVANLCATCGITMEILPATNDEIETQVVLQRALEGRPFIHFQEWWVSHRAKLPAAGFEISGIRNAKPAPGVIFAILQADVVIFAPSNPVVSIGAILQINGISQAIKETRARVVGLSPIIGASPVLGMADACLRALSIETSSSGVAKMYGARKNGGLLDAWLIADSDSDQCQEIESYGLLTRAVPLLMVDDEITATMAKDALALVNLEVAR